MCYWYAHFNWLAAGGDLPALVGVVVSLSPGPQAGACFFWFRSLTFVRDDGNRTDAKRFKHGVNASARC